MADNKYIIQEQENGSLMISDDVITTIVAYTVGEVEGIVGLVTKPGADIVEMFGNKNWGKGIKIEMSVDNTVSVECNVNIAYGQSVVNVAKATQDAVATAIESMTGIKVTGVNVNVCGIIRQ